MIDRCIWYNCQCGGVVTATWLERPYEPDYYVDRHYGEGPGGVCKYADAGIVWDRALPRAEWDDCPSCGERAGEAHNYKCPWGGRCG